MALNISAWSIRNPLPSIVFSIILLVLGWASFTKLAVTRLPSADIPVISVAVAQFGAAPNCETATEITGMSALGNRVTASFMKLVQPSTRRMIEKTMDGSGFRIDHAEIFKAISVPVSDRGPRRTWS
jgi:hypothetical protein